MSKLEIISNYHWRPFIYEYDLTDKEKEDFDWINPDDFDSHVFFRYKGDVYSLDQFMIINNHPDKEFSKWHSYESQTFFSGVVLKVSDDGEMYQVGRYYS